MVSKRQERLGHRLNRDKRSNTHKFDPADYGGKELEHELASQGLVIKEITGDGNCLFRSLSDQLGESNTHGQIRHDVVQYLRQHEDDFAVFIEEDFAAYVDRMSNDGVYGGNVELVAFARAYNKHLKIYQPGLSYIIKPTEDQGDSVASDEQLHLVYHSFEHYSSVRMAGGPSDGKPEICPTRTTIPPLEKRAETALASDLEKICLSSVASSTLLEVRNTMKECNGNVNAAIELMLERQNERDLGEEQEDEAKVDSTGQPDNATSDDADRSSEVDKSSASGQIENCATPLVTVPEKPSNRTVRLSARDKKDMAKRAQKERRRTEKRGSAARACEKAHDNDSKTRTIHI